MNKQLIILICRATVTRTTAATTSTRRCEILLIMLGFISRSLHVVHVRRNTWDLQLLSKEREESLSQLPRFLNGYGRADK